MPTEISGRRQQLPSWPLAAAIAALLLLVGCSGSATEPPPTPQPSIITMPAGQAVATAFDANPQPPPGALPWFEDVAAESGIDFVHQSGASGHFLMPEAMVGGAALFDLEGDGDLDIYLIQAGGVETPRADRPGNRLYRNDGDWHFTDITEGSGADDRGYGSGVAVGDYDDDGDPDLYVTNLEGNTLLRNEGGKYFSDVSSEAGVAGKAWSSSAAFLDYDLDGDLDLYVANFIVWSVAREILCQTTSGMRDYCGPTSYGAPAQDTLYRNEGDGHFSDVSLEAGMGGIYGNGLGVVVSDFDGDGLPDIFVANDGVPDQLWINGGDGTFDDRAGVAGIAVDEGGIPKAGMGTDAVDLDGDGDEDLLVVNLASETDSVYANFGTYFTDITRSLGLGAVTRRFTRFGTAFVDFDNDGKLDLYQANGRVKWQGDAFDPADPYAEPNILMRGTTGHFEEILPRGGTRDLLVATSRGAAFGDIDNDGGVDIVVVNRDAPPHVLRNIAPRGGHWLLMRVLEQSGRDALGARVTLRSGEQVFTDTVRSTFSYCSANDPRVHLGLGPLESLDAIEVLWQDGSVEAFEPPVGVDQIITLQRGKGLTQR